VSLVVGEQLGLEGTCPVSVYDDDVEVGGQLAGGTNKAIENAGTHPHVGG